MLFLRWRALKDEAICQESDDAGDLIPSQGKSHRPELRMIERKNGSVGRRCLDAPSGVGDGADLHALVVEGFARQAFHHPASRVAQLAYELVEFVERQADQTGWLRGRRGLDRDRLPVLRNMNFHVCIWHAFSPSIGLPRLLLMRQPFHVHGAERNRRLISASLSPARVHRAKGPLRDEGLTVQPQLKRVGRP